MFGGTIVHGILVSSLFSNLFGTSLPGSIYVSQNLNFKRPVLVGAEVTARIVITDVKDKRKGKLLLCSTDVRLADGSTCIAGEGTVLLLQSH